MAAATAAAAVGGTGVGGIPGVGGVAGSMLNKALTISNQVYEVHDWWTDRVVIDVASGVATSVGAGGSGVAAPMLPMTDDDFDEVDYYYY